MSTGLATRAKSDIQIYLEESISELAVACSKHVQPETVIQVINLCCYKNRKILDCDRPSILHSVIQGTSLGFSFHPSAGEAYLVPRFNKKLNLMICEFQPGYQGLCKLARESGKVLAVQAVLVRGKDTFRVTRINGEADVFHEENTSAMSEPITHVYAWAKLAGVDKPMVETMEIAEVEYIRSRSTTPEEGPWQTDYGEMTKKTAIRRMSKMLPKTPQLTTALAAFDRGFDMPSAQLDGTEKPKKIDNGTGHGSGKYASPGQVASYLKAMNAYLDKRNQQWLDRWNGREVDGLKELCNQWQADGHLAKWAEQAGMICQGSTPVTGIKERQIGAFTAIVYHASPEDRKAIAMELAAYLDRQEEIALKAIHRRQPTLFDPIDTSPETEPETTEPTEANPDLADDGWDDGRE